MFKEISLFYPEFTFCLDLCNIFFFFIIKVAGNKLSQEILGKKKYATTKSIKIIYQREQIRVFLRKIYPYILLLKEKK